MGKAISCNGASHVAQWWRINLPVQETQKMWVQSHMWWTKPEILLLWPFTENWWLSLFTFVGYPSNVLLWASQVALVVKNPPGKAGDAKGAGLIPGSGRSHGEGNGSPHLYFCLGNPIDRGAWWATVHEVAKSQTRLSCTSMRRTEIRRQSIQNDRMLLAASTNWYEWQYF